MYNIGTVISVARAFRSYPTDSGRFTGGCWCWIVEIMFRDGTLSYVTLAPSMDWGHSF